MSEINYHDKYLKYKRKYMEQRGGLEEKGVIVYIKHEGTVFEIKLKVNCTANIGFKALLQQVLNKIIDGTVENIEYDPPFISEGSVLSTLFSPIIDNYMYKFSSNTSTLRIPFDVYLKDSKNKFNLIVDNHLGGRIGCDNIPIIYLDVKEDSVYSAKKLDKLDKLNRLKQDSINIHKDNLDKNLLDSIFQSHKLSLTPKEKDDTMKYLSIIENTIYQNNELTGDNIKDYLKNVRGSITTLKYRQELNKIKEGSISKDMIKNLRSIRRYIEDIPAKEPVFE